MRDDRSFVRLLGHDCLSGLRVNRDAGNDEYDTFGDCLELCVLFDDGSFVGLFGIHGRFSKGVSRGKGRRR